MGGACQYCRCSIVAKFNFCLPYLLSSRRRLNGGLRLLTLGTGFRHPVCHRRRHDLDYNHGIYMNAITTFGVTPFTTIPGKGAGANSEDEAGDFFPQ